MDPRFSAPMASQAEAASGMETDGRFNNMDADDAALAEMLTRKQLEGPQEANGGTSAGQTCHASYLCLIMTSDLFLACRESSQWI